MHPELTLFLLNALPLLLILVPLVGAAAVRSTASLPAALHVGFAITTLTALLASLLVIAVGQTGDITVQAALAGYPGGTAAVEPRWTLHLALLATPFSSVGVWLIALIGLLTVIAAQQTTVIVPPQSPRAVLPGVLILQAALIGFVLAADLVLILLFGSMVSVVTVNWLRQNPALTHVTATGWLGFVFTPNVPIALAAVLAYGLGDSTSVTFLPIPTADWAQGALLGLLLLGFGLRLPLIPAIAELQRHVPTLAQPLLAAGSLLMAGHGLYHFGAPLQPLLTTPVINGILALAVLLMIYGGLRAWVERDLYRLLGAITVVQMGFIAMGWFAQDATATTGATLHTLNSTVITAALGFCFYGLNRRFGTVMIDELGGLAAAMPGWTAFLALFTFAVIGLPGTSAFVGELLIVLGTVHFHPLMAAMALIGMFLSGVYGLNLIRRIALGTPYRPRRTSTDVSTSEQVILVPLAVLVIGIGLFPHVLIELLNTSLLNVGFTRLALTAAP